MGRCVTVDPHSGFCAGVIHAIQVAEQALGQGMELYSLGALVHNNEELQRLEQKGLHVIGHDDLGTLPRGTHVLIRAHGEPPATYQTAQERGLVLLECTCTVVLALQRKIKAEYTRIKPLGGTILIFGKKGHAEVNGLAGSIRHDACILENEAQATAWCAATVGTRGHTPPAPDAQGRPLADVPLSIFSQTTQDPDTYQAVCDIIAHHFPQLRVFRTTCHQVANRRPLLEQFAQSQEVVLFVCGRDSSNGRILFEICRQANPNSHQIENAAQIDPSWLAGVTRIGICGATSTPKWLMEQIAHNLRDLS